MRMEWFDGGVLNAIIACRQNKALFVVYIYGEAFISFELEFVSKANYIHSVCHFRLLSQNVCMSYGFICSR